MKTFLAGILIAFITLLPGCKTDININLVNQIVQDCQLVCKFVPTIFTVTSLISIDPTVATVEAAVALICNAFNNLPVDVKREYKLGKVVTFTARTSNGGTIQIAGKVIN
jgi:hypothetical protein